MRDDWGNGGQSGVSHPTSGWVPNSFVIDIYRLPTVMSDTEHDLVGTPRAEREVARPPRTGKMPVPPIWGRGSMRTGTARRQIMIRHSNLVSNSARTKPVNWSLPLLISAFLFFAFSAQLSSADQRDRSHEEGAVRESVAQAPASSETREEISPSKLYEAVSGYLEGLHRKGPSDAQGDIAQATAA